MNLANLIAIQQWAISNRDVALLDPLNFDKSIETVHAMNQNKDSRSLINFLYQHLPRPDVLDTYDYDTALAAMRDLGIFIGSLKRHGIEPVEVMPELEYVLLVLMVKTDLPPRDTLLHYTVWNPSGERIRSYTGLPDEISLIESVKMALPSLMEAIVQLDLMHDSELHGNDFEDNCRLLKMKMEGMVRGIVNAKRNVSPGVFANELRFYFDPIKVDYNKEYVGPGAVEMPMFVFDHLLWSSDCDDSTYTNFKEGYLPYNIALVRDIYKKYKGRPSLISKIESTLKTKGFVRNYRAAKAVLDLCNVLKSFRMPHKKVAEEAYKHGEDHHRKKGSGGYSVSILDHIMNLQNEKLASLQAATSMFKINELV
ncbi:MAG TPA: monodechloroaminopyrrolnitrin synthase PrnB family protein [Cyclobacteriaceae bacterium]|jgi:hypothetical protein|nr:monodechloroaminopyrrolnitrin synthase PrnB family protein [Cyclobacteriaceae bacterium]